MRHLTAKIEFRAPKGSASQASAAVGPSSRWETVQMELFQDPKGILNHSSSRPDPIVEDHLLEVHTVAGLGPH